VKIPLPKQDLHPEPRLKWTTDQPDSKCRRINPPESKKPKQYPDSRYSWTRLL